MFLLYSLLHSVILSSWINKKWINKKINSRGHSYLLQCCILFWYISLIRKLSDIFLANISSKEQLTVFIKKQFMITLRQITRILSVKKSKVLWITSFILIKLLVVAVAHLEINFQINFCFQPKLSFCNFDIL